MRFALSSYAVIDAWFDNLGAEQRATARELQTLVLAAAPTVAQAIKWGNLMFLHGGSHAVAIVAHRAHVNLQIFNGALFAARFAQIEGTGRALRHLKFRYREPVDAELVTRVVKASVEAMG